MKKLLGSVFLSLCFTITGCKLIVMKLIGAKKPEVETFESIKSQYSSVNITEDNFYIMKEDSLFNQFFRFANEVRLFDKNGIMIREDSLAGMKGCSGNIVTFISSVPPVTYAYRDSSQSLSRCLNSIKHMEKNIYLHFDTTQYDYMAIVYWNSFSGREHNLPQLKRIMAAIENNKHSRIQFLPVNCDMYEGVDWDQKYEDYKAKIRASKAQN
jgi:hypothetical protein